LDGIKFGVGLAYSFNPTKQVTSADIINGVVRVKEENRARARVVLETHAFPFLLGKSNRVGLGPFAAVQPGGDDLIQAIGGGIMIGFRKQPKAREDAGGESFNIGLGVWSDMKAQVLGDGFKANQPPPPGETLVRFKTRDRGSVLVMASFSF
jgi:hypothetical protein